LKLHEVKKGQNIRILNITDEVVRAQAIRFGISEGEMLTCVEVVPAGPVVISRNRQEIALGRGLASEIEVDLVA
jgi:Fe2+ transport system protein FeoA